MAIRRSSTNTNSNGGPAESSAPANGTETPKFRENSEVNAKIDAYIEKNPKDWSYIQAMPRDRLERSLVLQAVQKEDRREKMRANIMKKLDENPEMKEAYRTLVKNLPAEKQEAAMVSLAMRTNRTVAPPAQKEAQGARV
jgi:hypothetical protein